jgi:acyl transferase domain-containing protein
LADGDQIRAVIRGSAVNNDGACHRRRARRHDAGAAGRAMLAVMLAESELKACLPSDLSIAAVNANAVCVVAGPHPAIDAFAAKLPPVAPAGGGCGPRMHFIRRWSIREPH